MDPAASLTVMQNRPPFPDGAAPSEHQERNHHRDDCKGQGNTQHPTDNAGCLALPGFGRGLYLGVRSDMRHANATAKVPFHERQNQSFYRPTPAFHALSIAPSPAARVRRRLTINKFRSLPKQPQCEIALSSVGHLNARAQPAARAAS